MYYNKNSIIILEKNKYDALYLFLINFFYNSSLEELYVPKYSMEFLKDTKSKTYHSFFEKYYDEGGSHWPDRWIIRNEDNLEIMKKGSELLEPDKPSV